MNPVAPVSATLIGPSLLSAGEVRACPRGPRTSAGVRVARCRILSSIRLNCLAGACLTGFQASDRINCMEAARADQRREAGLRTQARLLDAALNQISERGEDGVTLRELTDAAGANVAAVSYHFGSLKSLCDAAVEHALERDLDAQQEALSTLVPESSLEALAAAFARPMMRALAAGGRDLAVLRIVARAALDPRSAGIDSMPDSTGFVPMCFVC